MEELQHIRTQQPLITVQICPIYVSNYWHLEVFPLNEIPQTQMVTTELYEWDTVHIEHTQLFSSHNI